jgi:DNA primase large subunit
MPSAISEVQAVRADLRAAAAVQELSDCGEASEGLCPIREGMHPVCIQGVLKRLEALEHHNHAQRNLEIET